MRLIWKIVQPPVNDTRRLKISGHRYTEILHLFYKPCYWTVPDTLFQFHLSYNPCYWTVSGVYSSQYLHLFPLTQRNSSRKSAFECGLSQIFWDICHRGGFIRKCVLVIPGEPLHKGEQTRELSCKKKKNIVSNSWQTIPQGRAYKTTLPCGKVCQIFVIHGEHFCKGDPQTFTLTLTFSYFFFPCCCGF